MSDLDSRLGAEQALPPALAADLVRTLERLAADPARQRAVAAGALLDGTARRLGLAPGLQAFFRLPPREARRRTRARMAAVIADRVAGFGQVTRDDLEAAGFSGAEIAALFPAALRASGARAMMWA